MVEGFLPAAIADARRRQARRRIAAVLHALAVVAVAGHMTGFPLGRGSSPPPRSPISGVGGGELSGRQAEQAVAEVRKLGGWAQLLPRRAGVWQDHFYFHGGPGGAGWVKVRSDARRVSGGVEVTLAEKEPDFTGNHRWYRWKVLSAKKVVYEGEGGTRCWPPGICH